ncbi:MAG: AraC family transcriptional regulator [Bacilli bacterium]|nr:AraC family transcriptional regulator [Bacilli bacterium]
MRDHFYFPGFFTSVHIWSVTYQNVEKGWVFRNPNHKHPLFEILYCESGQMSEWVNGVEHRLQAGDFILINSGAMHYPEAHEKSRFFNYHFDIEPREIHNLFHRLGKPIVSSEQSSEIKNEIEEWMKRTLNRFQTEGEMTLTQKMILQSDMLQFLAFVLDEIVMPSIKRDSEVSRSKYHIATDAAYLLETFGGSESVQISELSNRLHVHRNYVTNCFKQVYGVSPKQYLNKVKIEKAKKFLQQTTMSIEDVAAALMFSSSAYFSKFFRTHVGITPLKYRTGDKM